MPQEQATTPNDLRYTLISCLHAHLQQSQSLNRKLREQLHHNSHSHYQQLSQKQQECIEVLKDLEKDLEAQHRRGNKLTGCKTQLDQEIIQYQTRLSAALRKEEEVKVWSQCRDSKQLRMQAIREEQLQLRDGAGLRKNKLEYLKDKLRKIDQQLRNEEKEIGEIEGCLGSMPQCKHFNQPLSEFYQGNTVSTVQSGLMNNKIQIEKGKDKQKIFTSPIYVSTEDELMTLNQFDIM